MQSQTVSEIAAESRALIAACRQNLLRLGEQIAACTASREGGRPARRQRHTEPLEAQLCRESAHSTRAFSEEANDPEVKRLLLELAGSYDRMLKRSAASPDTGGLGAVLGA
ncbi:MAG: hypothetical protein ACLPX9_07745 [Rhodomicrobium sp.]